MRRPYSRILLSIISAALVAGSHAAAQTSGRQKVFLKSAVENADHTVTLPLYQGASRGRTVYFIVLDTSDGALSDALGVNQSAKLANARGTKAVQTVTVANGMIDFPASVDFAPERMLVGPDGQPQPGAKGEDGYSPLIELPGGIIVNAPHIAIDANGDGRITLRTEAADKVVSIDVANRKVRYLETDGFQGGDPVRYVSTDASGLLAATLEDATYAPALNEAPTLDNDGTDSSRTSLAAFVNGQMGVNNPQRQGLNSAVAGEGDPLNVLRWNPSQGRYSPLWDVHLAAWTPRAIAAGLNLRQRDWGDITGLVSHGLITGPDGAPFGAAGFIVNCPIVSRQ